MFFKTKNLTQSGNIMPQRSDSVFNNQKFLRGFAIGAKFSSIWIFVILGYMSVIIQSIRQNYVFSGHRTQAWGDFFFEGRRGLHYLKMLLGFWYCVRSLFCCSHSRLGEAPFNSRLFPSPYYIPQKRGGKRWGCTRLCLRAFPSLSLDSSLET